MEARLIRAALLAVVLCSMGAGYRTANFIIDAPTKELAEEIGRTAEQFRHDLAMEWLGKPMPNWSQPCPITAQVAPNLGAGGATSFLFDHGEVFGWKMNIQGSRERLLDSVLPHEITHTVFATHFRQPLPRWADEGACTTVEHASEKAKQQNSLLTYLRTGRGIAFSTMFAMKEYPQDVLPLYAQGYSLARFLIEQGGKSKYIEFVGEGLKNDDWTAALNHNYGFNSLATLQSTWLEWVKQGSPALETAEGKVEVVASTNRRPRPEPNLIYRGQSGDSPATVHTVANNDVGGGKKAYIEPTNIGPGSDNASTEAGVTFPSASPVRPTGLKTSDPRPVYERGLPAVEQSSDARGTPDRNISERSVAQTDVGGATAEPHPQVLLEWSRPTTSTQ